MAEDRDAPCSARSGGLPHTETKSGRCAHCKRAVRKMVPVDKLEPADPEPPIAEEDMLMPEEPRLASGRAGEGYLSERERRRVDFYVNRVRRDALDRP